MGRFIVKLTDEKDNNDYYLEWSTVVDAPVTYGMSLEYFKEYYEVQYGTYSLPQLEERLKRVEQNGTSGRPPYDNLNELLEYNRAGDNETHLDKDGLIEKYCRLRNANATK